MTSERMDVTSVTLQSIDSDLLHPDLLSTDVLIQILNERKLKINELSSMTRPALLELFMKFCLPHAQRRSKYSNIRQNHSQNIPKLPRFSNSNSESVLSTIMNATTLSDLPDRPVQDQSGNKIQINSNLDIRIKTKCCKRKEQYYPPEKNSQPNTKKPRTKITWP